MHRIPSRFLGARTLLCLLLAGTCSTGVAQAGQTTLHLKLMDWNLPAGTRIHATVRARLKVFRVNREAAGPDGKPKAEVQAPIDDLAPQSLSWDVVTRKGSRASKEMDFTFPVKIGGVQQLTAGEVFETSFEVAAPGRKAGEWTIVLDDHSNLGLFLDGDQRAHPTACIRLTKDPSGYNYSLAYECTAKSFAAVAAQTSPCAACAAGQGGSSLDELP